MTRAKILLALFGTLLLLEAADAMAAGLRRAGCRSGDRIRIQDLDISPDPIFEGQRIRNWRVRINFAGVRACETTVVIREDRETVGRRRDYTLRPGLNEFDVPPSERYRFRGREHCFDVLVDLEGTRRRADADRRFCARQRASWSMRDRGERRLPREGDRRPLRESDRRQERRERR